MKKTQKVVIDTTSHHDCVLLLSSRKRPDKNLRIFKDIYPPKLLRKRPLFHRLHFVVGKHATVVDTDDATLNAVHVP